MLCIYLINKKSYQEKNITLKKIYCLLTNIKINFTFYILHIVCEAASEILQPILIPDFSNYDRLGSTDASLLIHLQRCYHSNIVQLAAI